MSQKALFEGLVFDEREQPVAVVLVGGEACYVVDDGGFLRHIDAQTVDRQVLQSFKEMIKGHEDTISEQAAKMLGQDDIFSRASLAAQIKNMEQYFDRLFETGLPEDQRAYMGMLGFRVRINLHGEVVAIDQPGMVEPDEP